VGLLSATNGSPIKEPLLTRFWFLNNRGLFKEGAITVEELRETTNGDAPMGRCPQLLTKQLCFAKGCARRYAASMKNVVTRDPEILGGEPVFAGTRVPIKSLFDHLEAADSIADFLEGFPSVRREQVLALLEESKAHAMQNQ